MAYPEKLLANDERISAHLHPHWITLVPATLWFIVICAAAGVGIAYAPNRGTSQLVVVILVSVVGLFLLSWLAFSPWIRWKTTHYVFTSHRVLIRRGVFRHTGRDIALQRISDVAFTQSLWDRMVKAGTLTIESAGEHGQETLEDIPRSDMMQQTLNRLIEDDSDRRARAAYGGFQQGGPQPGYPQGQPQQGYTQQGQPGYPPQGPSYPPTQEYPPSQQ